MAAQSPAQETGSPPPSQNFFRRFSRSAAAAGTDGPVAGGANGSAVPIITTKMKGNTGEGETKVTPFKKLKTKLGLAEKRRKRVDDQAASPSLPVVPDDDAQTHERATEHAGVAVDGDEDPGAPSGVQHEPTVAPAADTEGDPGPAPAPATSTATLARAIHTLLSAFPPFYAGLASKAPEASSEADASAGAGAGAGGQGPVPGAGLADSRLLSLLSSASAMNGSVSKGRESVWAILERLGHPRYTSPAPSSADVAMRDKNAPAFVASLDDKNVEVSSVMICCPLEPTEDTEIEIAHSEVVSIDIAETTAASASKRQGELRLWPFGKGKVDSTTPGSPSVTVTEVRVWVPSRTKVSLQAAWWGYRIYLPPPVMKVLSDQSIEAAKRAAMIATVLTWLVSHIPTDMLPVQLQAVVGILKGIVPIIGYVSGFIAWSWSTIQSFDKGQGVILSATWLLPIALIPGTWNYTDPSSGGTPSVPAAPTTTT